MKDQKIHSELKELLKEKSRTCVSVIVPLHKNPSFAKSDKIVIDHVIEKLNVLMSELYKPAVVNDFTRRVRVMEGRLNLSKGIEGLGVFISPKMLKIVSFPFQVKERIVVGDSFELRDVMYKEFLQKDYFVLSLNTKEARLHKGRGNTFTEIKNKDFPATFTDDYEYQRPSRGNSFGYSLKQFERDRSNVQELRAESFYHEVDKKLHKYLQDHTPLVLAGVKKDLGYFEKETVNKKWISGKVFGSFDGYNASELQGQAWEKVKEHVNKEQQGIISQMNELFGKRLVSTGIRNVWRDAHAGKGNVLVVEKDFTKPAFLGEDESKLLSRAPDGDHKIINDAVDEIIGTVMKKNGKIVFTENGKLKDFEGIALIKRYA